MANLPEPHPGMEEIYDLLNRSDDNTPPFLRGVLLSPEDFCNLMALLRSVERDAAWGKRYIDDLPKTIAAGERAMGEFVKAILENDITVTPRKREQEHGVGTCD